jgi:ABC-type branched-subunit amino acid transport system permease subunit
MDSYIRRIVNLCMIYAIIGLSMNLTNGFVGQFALGQAGFMAIGAYAVGIFTVPVAMRPGVFYATPMNPAIINIYMPLWLALIVGGLAAALSSVPDWYACAETAGRLFSNCHFGLLRNHQNYYHECVFYYERRLGY